MIMIFKANGDQCPNYQNPMEAALIGDFATDFANLKRI